MNNDLTFNQLSKKKKDCQNAIEKAIAEAIDKFEISTGFLVEKVKVSVTTHTDQSLPIVISKIYTNLESTIDKS